MKETMLQRATFIGIGTVEGMNYRPLSDNILLCA
ncbi:hypothetical protein A2U01_0007488, partial [Trifolium medium]|nr:hypothetical protein [Trifolium medium]